VFHDATTQKKGFGRLRVTSLVKRDQDAGGTHDKDWFNSRLLNLPGEKQRYGAIVVLIIGIRVDEFVQARTDRQHRGPLEDRYQKQSDDLCTAGSDRNLLGGRLLGFPVTIHEMPQRLVGTPTRTGV
jgi:hypothetical protein